MIPHLVYYQLVILVLLWLCLMLPHLWPSPPREMPQEPAEPIKPKRKHSSEPQPFAGLTQKPHCAWCEQGTAETAFCRSVIARPSSRGGVCQRPGMPASAAGTTAPL